MQCVLALGYRLPFEILLHYAYNFDVLGDIRCLEMRALAEELGVIYFDRLDNKGAKVGNLNVKGTVVLIRHSCNPKLPSVYTVEILDFVGQKDEFVQMLYDRTPTLPQRLRFGDEYIRNLWTNLGWRIFRT